MWKQCYQQQKMHNILRTFVSAQKNQQTEASLADQPHCSA
uniref:Uncharacterized protein n=1 Tax=Parascaris univalens TaxID=6257 RepID=A0A915CEU7_PARUN